MLLNQRFKILKFRCITDSYEKSVSRVCHEKNKWERKL